MFIFLDESGDLGFDFKTKSPTNMLTITLLVCKSNIAVNRLICFLEEFSKSMSIKMSIGIRFSKTESKLS